MINTFISPPELCDSYKLSHHQQYPPGLSLVMSNCTPRKSRDPNYKGITFCGLQYFIKEYLIKHWNEYFFKVPFDIAIEPFQRRITKHLGAEPDVSRFKSLYELGHLPLRIMAVPEGTFVPIGVPALVIWNTNPEFAWLTNSIESIMSNVLWMPCTSATIAREYRKLFEEFAEKTHPEGKEIVPFQAHNFSFRGMAGLEAACLADLGHLSSFVGSDTVPGIGFVEEYYSDHLDSEIIGKIKIDEQGISYSVPATEHSVMCAWGQGNELELLKHLITNVYPTGIVSIVSDTWNLWKLISEYLPTLKDIIIARDGKLVIRPDSSPTTPQDIICGYDDVNIEYYTDINYRVLSRLGVIQCLWDIFGGSLSSTGYKVLDPHIGCIYGDAITLSRATEICNRLTEKGFASTNMIYGVGSFTYQYNTRDTFGFAMKATYCEVDGEPREIFKDPITDGGFKKSAKGITSVFRNDNGDFYLKDQSSLEELFNCELQTVFFNGSLYLDDTLGIIRDRVLQSLELEHVNV